MSRFSPRPVQHELHFFIARGKDVAMYLHPSFLFDSCLLGIGLAMDAFTVSIADGLTEPHMKKKKSLFIAALFALFQWCMPMLGRFLVLGLTESFQIFRPWTPVISLILLLYIGGKMAVDGLRRGSGCDVTAAELSLAAILLQALATSIDALSVGFTIAAYSRAEALSCSLIIGGVTLLLCLAGLLAGKRLGSALCGKSKILGGCILILIGLKIFFGSL